MTTGTDGPEQRIAIWSLSARVIGAYFVIFLIQYVPGAAFEAYSRLGQRAADETLVHAAVEVVKACGPIGIGAATNAFGNSDDGGDGHGTGKDNQRTSAGGRLPGGR